MTIAILPDDLNLASNQSVQLFDYNNFHEITKQQVVLTQNTFSFLTEGTKEVIFDNATLSIDNSRFLLMKSGHCLMTEKLSQTQNYRSILLFFNNETLIKLIREITPNITPPTEYKSSIYSFKYDEFILRFVNSLVDIAKLSPNIQNKLLEVKLKEIILYLLEIQGTDFLSSLTLNTNDTSQKFIKTIEGNQLNNLSVKELAFLCNMSVSTFKREFEKHYSESPIKWFQNKRLAHAHYLIHQQQKKSSEVYFEVGYENLSSFIQAYKIKYGITPKQDSKI